MDYRDIIRLIGTKEKAGIDALYNEYAAKLYQYAVRQWHFSEDDAWETVYKTMHTLLLKLPSYELTSAQHFTNLIFKIFKNNLRQCYRNKLSKEASLEFVSVEHLENEPDVHLPVERTVFEDYYQNEVLESPLFLALKNALEKLSQEDKELLLLKAQNYSYKEIGVMMGIDDEGLKVKHHRAKKKLVDLIAKQQIGVYEQHK